MAGGQPVGVQVRVLGLAAVILCNNLNMYEIMEVRRGVQSVLSLSPMAATDSTGGTGSGDL